MGSVSIGTIIAAVLALLKLGTTVMQLVQQHAASVQARAALIIDVCQELGDHAVTIIARAAKARADADAHNADPTKLRDDDGFRVD